MPNLGIKMPKMGTRPKRTEHAPARRNTQSAKKRRSLHRTSLIDALFSSTRKRVLALLFGQPERSFFTTELIHLTGSGSGAVQRELHRLADAGLVVMTKLGSQKHFQANRAAPVFEELRLIVVKTVGLAEPIKAALVGIEEPLQLAIIYGSIAKQADTASSDVDLLIVSDGLLLEKAYGALAPAEQMISRKINVILLTPEEFERRRTDNSPFLSNVLAGEHLVLIGDTDGIVATRKSGSHPTA